MSEPRPAVVGAITVLVALIIGAAYVLRADPLGDVARLWHFLITPRAGRFGSFFGALIFGAIFAVITGTDWWKRGGGVGERERNDLEARSTRKHRDEAS